MKKVISISLVLIMLAAVLHLAVASHYCRGKLVESRISLSGKLAECGMETGKTSIPGTWITSHCCDNKVLFIGISGGYFPYSFFSGSFHSHQQIFEPDSNITWKQVFFPNSINTDTGPPGAILSSDVDLSGICVFRI